MMAVGVGATAGYINWNGTKDYEDAMADLDLINQKSGIVINNLEDAKERISELEELSLTDKETIANLESEVAQHELFRTQLKNIVEGYIRDVNDTNGVGRKYDKLVSIINENVEHIGVEEKLDTQGTSQEGKQMDDQLKQAEKDMSNIKNKTSSVLETLKDVEIPETEDEDVENTTDPEQ